MEAGAQGVAKPLRFLMIHHPCGAVRDQWLPPGNGPALTLSPTLAPFAPVKSHMVVIDGLNIMVWNAKGNTHEAGMVGVCTGAEAHSQVGEFDSIAGSQSIDQMFLERSPRLKGSAFGSLQLAADIRCDRQDQGPRVMSYAKPPASGRPATPMFPEVQPLDVYMRIFAGVMPGGGSADNQAALERARARKQSLLDFLRSDLGRLSQLAPSSEKDKIDSYTTAIRDLEKTFDQMFQPAPGGGGGVCSAPAAPMRFATPANQAGTNPYHGTIGKLHLEIVRAAFVCDLVRVATFMWAPGSNHVVFGGLFPGMPTQEHHPNSHDSGASGLKICAAVDTWYAQQTADALLQFKNTPDPNGGSLLDNTAVAYVSEVARAYDHVYPNAPVAVFGGPGVRLAGDRFLKFSDRPMNDMFLSLGQGL
jgi:hypothetical protein